jgi:transposase
MEDVLNVYQQPYDPACPVVTFDERPVQLVSETRQPIPAQAGQLERYDYDYEYKREGTANLFEVFQPLLGWRHIDVTEQRAKIDFARCMKDLVDVRFPEADKIKIVLDNLNTHDVSSLYEAFEPAEALRIASKLEFHFTPKHGSWLNMTEIEFSILSRQALGQRIPDIATLKRVVDAWQTTRNADHITIQWRFTPEVARQTLANLYPSI